MLTHDVNFEIIVSDMKSMFRKRQPLLETHL